MKILLLEDELMLQEAIEEYLEDKGYIVTSCIDGMEAYAYIMNNSYDLLILDINTPVLNGLKLLEKIQIEKFFIPTVFISAITEIEQISKAYELGCYDYLKKPFHLKELTLHIDRLLKIAKIRSKSMVNISKMYSYDLERSRLYFDNEEQVLTPKQTQIMYLFASNINRIVDFDMLCHYVWKDDFVDNATIRAEVHRVKKVLKENLIQNIKGIGYKINTF